MPIIRVTGWITIQKIEGGVIMWLIFFYGSAIGIFAVIIYLVMRFIHAFENSGSYPSLEDVIPLEYE